MENRSPSRKITSPFRSRTKGKQGEKGTQEARAILMERRDIEPGCPVPQRSPEIPPDKDY